MANSDRRFVSFIAAILIACMAANTLLLILSDRTTGEICTGRLFSPSTWGSGYWQTPEDAARPTTGDKA